MTDQLEKGGTRYDTSEEPQAQISWSAQEIIKSAPSLFLSTQTDRRLGL